MANVSNASLDSGNSTSLPYVSSGPAANIWIYGGAIVIISGTVGNVMSVVVMMSRNLRSRTTSFYLVVLAAVDEAVLCTGLMRYWIRETTGNDVRTRSSAACKVHIFVLYFLVQFEPWIIVWVSVERLVAIFIPHRARILFTRRSAAAQVAATGITLILVNLHFLWTVDLVDGACKATNEDHDHFLSEVWTWLDFVLSSFGPFVIMLGINLSIIVRLVYLHKTKKQQTSGSKTRMNTMTAILLTINFVFFLTTAPIAIFLSTEKYWTAVGDRATLDTIFASVNIVAYTNNAINFVLYCLSGPTFRKELVKILKTGACPRQVSPSEASNTETVATVDTQMAMRNT